MKEEYIERLKNKRQLNVQEQNILTKYKIKSEALYYRQHGISCILGDFLKEKEIDIKNSIITQYDLSNAYNCSETGLIITKDGCFFSFELELSTDKSQIIDYEWEDVTKNFEISEYKKGVGKTYGFLALEVLRELIENQNLEID